MAIVLVVDDEFGIAELMDAVLTDEGHRVLIAVNGKKGLDVLAREHPDLVFLDYMMPVMDGAAMLRRIQADSALADIPVVIMSSILETTVAERCTAYAGFLLKPFRITDVVLLTEKLAGKGEAASPRPQP